MQRLARIAALSLFGKPSKDRTIYFVSEHYSTDTVNYFVVRLALTQGKSQPPTLALYRPLFCCQGAPSTFQALTVGT
jgi:hypothetical protein